MINVLVVIQGNDSFSRRTVDADQRNRFDVAGRNCIESGMTIERIVDW